MKSGIPLPARKSQNAHAAMSRGVPHAGERRAPPPAAGRPRLRQPIPSRPSLLIKEADQRAPQPPLPTPRAAATASPAVAKPVHDEADNFWHIEAEKEDEDLDKDTVFDITGGAWEPAGMKMRRHAQRILSAARKLVGS